ncbi:hypothetical protein CORC01_06750 [Colletotrichum orchidophilum]|uniref:Uncharacterized protein n=1 Tax=Colletotrichum orchidophilum TaxID=1209926 RepID=A0A1G4B8Y8_9PEZI|nr:uncharacterized protein CORC01_06750 [Colletotrichum orchidophilum]OHE97887.1 hypothetical protein CORC01_06750 [Colletotrichum orchidophilum]
MVCVRELEKQPVEKVMEAVRVCTAFTGHLYEHETRLISVAASLRTSLSDNVRDMFPREHNPEDRSINRELTIRNLVLYNKCRVYWTDRLDRHLDYRVSRGKKVILVFQHKIWLSAHLGQDKHCVIPQDIIGEALDSLNLLFPQNNTDTEKFLRKRGQRFYSLGYCGRDRRLSLADYPHWGHKIEKLIDVFEGPRSGIWRFLPRHDRFDLMESANFWIATAAALLAFVGFILGLMSIVYAKWSYDVGVKSMVISEESLELTRLQYQLSLAQACSDPNEARLLPDFCSAEE